MPIHLERFPPSNLPPFVLANRDTLLGTILQDFKSKQGEWNWLLARHNLDDYSVCSFGSLLPYLLERTPHIIHNLGQCTICSSMPSMLWRDTPKLLGEVLSNEMICSRLADTLPMAELHTADRASMGTDAFFDIINANHTRVAGVTNMGELTAIYVARTRAPEDSASLPSF